MSKGIFPIRDMYSHVTPYYYLFYGSMMSITGFDMISARLITYAVGSIIGILTFLIIYNNYFFQTQHCEISIAISNQTIKASPCDISYVAPVILAIPKTI